MAGVMFFHGFATFGGAFMDFLVVFNNGFMGLIGFNGNCLGFGAVQGILCNLEDHGSGYVSSVSENVMIKPSKIACRHFFTWLESHWLLVDSVILGGW